MITQFAQFQFYSARHSRCRSALVLGRERSRVAERGINSPPLSFDLEMDGAERSGYATTESHAEQWRALSKPQ